MNSGNGENQVNFELPQAPEQANEDTSLEAIPSRSPENKPQSQSAQTSLAAAQSYALPSQTVTQAIDDSNTPTVQASSQQTDKSTDRIDKVWIDKARSVIAKTKDDPYEQNRQMSQVKAEYIKTRFNKSIKTDDAVAK
jgi:hypothetical protein